MTKEYVNVRLTWNSGYSKIVKMTRHTYNFYVKDRHLLNKQDYHAIDWTSDDYNIALSFCGLISMEIVGESVWEQTTI